MIGQQQNLRFTTDGESVKSKDPQFDIDEILDEIAKNGVGKVSTEKMIFLNKFK